MHAAADGKCNHGLSDANTGEFMGTEIHHQWQAAPLKSQQASRLKARLQHQLHKGCHQPAVPRVLNELPWMDRAPQAINRPAKASMASSSPALSLITRRNSRTRAVS